MASLQGHPGCSKDAEQLEKVNSSKLLLIITRLLFVAKETGSGGEGQEKSEKVNLKIQLKLTFAGKVYGASGPRLVSVASDDDVSREDRAPISLELFPLVLASIAGEFVTTNLPFFSHHFHLSVLW